MMQGEMLEFPGNTFGLALNLERDSVGVVIRAGDKVIDGSALARLGEMATALA